MAAGLIRNLLLMMTMFLMPFVAMGAGWQPWREDSVLYGVGLTLWILGFTGVCIIYGIHANRRWTQLVDSETRAGTLQLPKQGLANWLDQWEGRNWTSETKFLGLPLVQILMSSPESHIRMSGPREKAANVARMDRHR